MPGQCLRRSKEQAIRGLRRVDKILYHALHHIPEQIHTLDPSATQRELEHPVLV
ncbi:hypothetical protein D3C79_915060 [compost metagenome]